MAWLKALLFKVFLLYGFTILFAYVLFRVFYITFVPYFIFLSILLFLAELHNALQFFTMIYSLWPRKYPVFDRKYTNKKLHINLFICVCGEPTEIVKETILAAKKAAQTYVKAVKPLKEPQIIVLNDGFAAKKDNWKDIENLARELGVVHLKRNTTQGYKAGNINNGLSHTPTKDPHNTLDMVLDADFEVIPEFLLEITKPFADQTIDFVQTPQRYKYMNTWVAQASAAHQIHFFNHVCPAKAYDNALFLCGTNFAIRRSALTAVGGMDERFITEDYATSLNLHLLGKKGAFIKKALAYGVAPSSLKAYFSQQQRWSKGTFDTSFTYWKQILTGPLTLQQRFQYIVSSLYYLSGIRNLIFMIAPLPYLFFGVFLMKTNAFNFFAFVYGPLFLYNFLLYFLFFDHPLKSWVLDTISFPVFIASFLSSALKKDLEFVVTIKKYRKENIFHVYKVQLAVATMLIIGLFAGVSLHHIAHNFGEYINYFWVVFNIAILLLGFYLFTKDNYKEDINTVTMKFLHAEADNMLAVIEKSVSIPALAVALIFLALQVPAVHTTVSQTLNPLAVQAQDAVPEDVLVPTTGTYYGYYLPELNKHPQNPTTNLVPNEKTSLAMYYQDWADTKPFASDFMYALAKKNVVPILTWEPWNAHDGEQGHIAQAAYTPAVIASGKYDDYIRSFAKQIALYHKPFFLRFAHEMNGDWYAWGDIKGNTPDDYIAMWRHVHDIFVQEGATNAIWVWAPNNVDNTGSTTSIMHYYPGGQYVDWVGFSGFNWGTTTTAGWKSFAEIAAPIYPMLAELDKPIMVAETSSVTGTNPVDKSQWFAAMTNTLATLSNIKAVVFYNDNYKGSDFRLSSGMNATDVISQDFVHNDYFLKNPLFIEKPATTGSTVTF